jgi:glycosyltransferase involved in cell wall biosynthesis
MTGRLSSALHVAALPFPTTQGTQAAIAAMLRALEGRSPELLAYAHGDPRCAPPPARVTRLARSYGDRSRRSGPSLAKVMEDGALAATIARRRPELVVAHHVEAAAAALLARAPTIFVAHTALGPELPTYASRGAALLTRAGDALDRALARRADATVAVSPLLASRLSALADVDVPWLPIPWPLSPPIAREERDRARAELGIHRDERIVLYAGNLDRYQGLDALFDAMRAMPDARLLVATSSDDRMPGDLRLLRAPLGDEPDRRRVHAAADVVAIPRASEGGLPIKMIDAMARGAPVAAVRRATAGLALDGVIAIADDDARALATTLGSLLDDPARGRASAERARQWIARELSRERFLAAYDGAISTAHARRLRKTGP